MQWAWAKWAALGVQLHRRSEAFDFLATMLRKPIENSQHQGLDLHFG
jgi:hypothetical protein